jgi:hypothetical protein
MIKLIVKINMSYTYVDYNLYLNLKVKNELHETYYILCCLY